MTTYGTFTFDTRTGTDADSFLYTDPLATDATLPQTTGTSRRWCWADADTPSTGVGPTSGQGGSPDGYLYTEASGSSLADEFLLEFDTTLNATLEQWQFNFYTNQRGTDNNASCQVQINESGGGWTDVGAMFGGPSDPNKVATDGVTPETALTIAQADMQLSKDGAAFAQKNTAGNATHDTDGWYSTTLDATDTNTTGELKLQVNVSGALPVWVTYFVLTQSAYDSLQTGTFNNIAATDIVSSGAITTSGGAVSNVTTVATTTTNTDMRGTDSALLASSAPANFSDLAITVTTGQVTVGTNNDKTGYTASTVTDKTGYSISGTITTLDDLNNISASDVWGVATRELTSGNNIVLAKGVGLTGLNDIAAADVLAAGDVDGFTLEESQKLILAASAGTLSGAATTTVTINAADGSKARLTATVDADGNRSSVIKDATG